MNDIAIVCDSSASIPEAIRAELNIHLVPIYIHHGDKVWRDLIDIRQDEFYQWLPTLEKLPSTAYPGPDDFLKTYELLAAEGYKNIISIHITSKSSGTYQAAKLAGEMAEEKLGGLRVEAFDTLNVAMCHGWMVIEAARAAHRGTSVDEIICLLNRIVPTANMIQTADTLKYLHMGGRIGSAAHLMGSVLNIKPLIGMRDGVIVPLGREHSRKKVYKAMVNMVEETVGSGSKIKVAYLHAAAPDQIEIIRSMLEKRVKCVESLVAELSPALGVHSGPGTTGICYFPVSALENPL